MKGQNRLAAESSLYLRQHADNPVNWWPWCEEAFDTAKREGKPVLVSIGYSSCHWCHVMAHECFEDDYIAELMNRLFINIKVDREERPDVDQIYMEAIQMLNQQGGWPLNVFCFPDKKPFTGGTYFPPDDRGYGIIPWPHLLLRISDAYLHDQQELRSNADAIQSNLEFLSDSVLDDDRNWNPQLLKESASVILNNLDYRFGGLVGAPKFPPSQLMGFLLAVANSPNFQAEESSFKTKISEAVRLCSHALVRGGLYDHVGGGFFRYSVDETWRVPHFEKMLYDNAMILEALSKAWTHLQWEGITGPVQKTVEFLLDDFQVASGVFASALDADSPEGEGAYYLWSEQELRESVSALEIEDFLEAFSIRGKDRLNLYPWAIEDREYRLFSPILNDLKDLRTNRVMPQLDKKIILSWNALLLRSLSIAGFVFNELRWLKVARSGLDFIWKKMRRSDGSLLSVYYLDGMDYQGGSGFLDDFVNLALANVHFAMVADVMSPGLSNVYLERAIELTRKILSEFSDDKEDGEGFYFCNKKDSEKLIVRKKEWFDNAYPSGNSSIVHLLVLLNAVDDQLDYGIQLNRLRNAYVERSRRMPNGIAFGLEGLTWDLNGVASIKCGVNTSLSEIADGVRKLPWRPVWIRQDVSIPDGKIQTCQGNKCFAPTSSLAEVLRYLG